MAFLINAYNAYTVELILSKYRTSVDPRPRQRHPQQPLKKKFFTLLGEPQHLTHRARDAAQPGVYDEPRIHFA